MEAATAQLVITPLWSTDAQFNAIEEEVNSYHLHDAYLKILHSGDIDKFLWSNIKDSGFGTFRYWIMGMSPSVGRYPMGVFLDNGLVSFCVLYNLTIGFKCEVALWVHPEQRGGMSREIGRQLLGAIHALDIPTIWAYTPWQNAVKLCIDAGMKPTAKLPSYIYINNAPHDVFVLRHDEATGGS